LGMGALATPLFQLILGSEWMDAVPYFQILCLSAIFYPVHAFNVNILKVCGRSDLFLKSVIIKKALILSIVLIAIGFSIEALLWSTLVTSIIGLFINTYFNKNLINYSIQEQLSDLIYTTIITVTMGAIVLTFINYNLPIGSLFNLLLGTLIGILSYGVLSFLFNKTIFTTVVKLIK
ncbi:polysaccharide biosynthesis C-terminal domain-containing protein, partial [bacterium]|nr:polysaccharide biosynthesis C-terminal domain-containing protein [bacterium]